METSKNFEVREDLRQSEEYGKYIERIGGKAIKIQDPGEANASRSRSKIQIFIRKLGPVSIAKIQRVDLPLPWEKLDQVLKKYRIFMCKLEPNKDKGLPIQELRSKGFKQDSWPMLGTKTIRLSISPNIDSIISGFKKDARYCVRNAQNSVINIQLNDFEGFYEMWRKANKIKGLWTPPKKDFYSLIESWREKCFCVLINNLAGCVILVHKKTAFYYYSGSLPDGKRANLPYLVIWEAIKEAKKRRALVWDFEGIYDPRWPNNSWKGFSHFKKSFGGEEVEYCGSFTRWRLPF